jgi:hypothetical protein
MKLPLLALTLALFTARAQEEPAPATNTLQKASTFIGNSVTFANGKQIGKVEDLVFDANKGQIGYAVIVLESRRVAVPITALRPAGECQWTLNMSEAVLAAAEGLQEDNWPAVDAFALGGPPKAETGSAKSDAAGKEPEESRTKDASPLPEK